MFGAFSRVKRLDAPYAEVIVMTEERDTRREDETDDDRSLIEKTEDKIKDVLDAPEAADDPGKTNPVTGQLRDP
jgi:hypothetical protein